VKIVQIIRRIQMKRTILIVLLLSFFSCYLFSQQKYKIIEKGMYYPSTKMRVEAISGYIFAGKHTGAKFNFLLSRYKYINIGLFTALYKLDYEDQGYHYNDRANALYWLPLGIYFPLTKRIGFNTLSYFLPSKGDKDTFKEIPNFHEINLKFDYEFDERIEYGKNTLLSLSAGYRFQSGKWNMFGSPDPGHTYLLDIGELDGFFIELAFGFGVNYKNEYKSKKKKVEVPNPSLIIYSSINGQSEDIMIEETKNLGVHINNNGHGLAEDLELRISTNKYLSTKSEKIYIGNLNPHSSTNIEIPITAKKVEEKTNVKLSLNLVEKDGFTAKEDIEITILPEIQPEKFPPIFSINANLKESNGNMLLDALEKGEIEITIKNTGRGNAWAVEPEIEIEQSNIINYLKFYKDLLSIRNIEPGGTANVKIPIEADWEIPTGKVKMKIICKEGNGFDSAPVNFSFETQEFLEPKLVITDVGIDDSESINTFGDGDNIIENMETIEVTTIVQNQGQGKAKDVKAKININNENISYFGDEIYSLGDLETGDFESVSFTILVNNKYSGSSQLPISINVSEYYNRYGFSNNNLNLELNKITLASKDINIEGRKHIRQKIPTTPILSVDIEKDLPKSDLSIEKGISVVIGNKDYDFYPQNSVEYAINDKRITERYSEHVFKYRTILGGENLGFAKFRNIFGTEDNPEGELYRTLRVEEPVFIYITGHGHSKPQLNQKAVSYIVPKDGNGYDLDATCYPIDILYNNLSYLIEKKKPEKLILILDMCFSGYLTTAVSSARWESNNPLQDLIDVGKQSGTDVVCILATQEAQTAKWYQEKKHGLLTYFVLKAFHNSENEGGFKADYNNDKKLTLGELKRFVLDENYGVPYFANQREVVGNSDLGQLPVIIGDDKMILLEYK